MQGVEAIDTNLPEFLLHLFTFLILPIPTWHCKSKTVFSSLFEWRTRLDSTGRFFWRYYIFYIINILVIRTILSIHYWFIWHYFMSIYPVPVKDNHNWWTKLQDPWVTPSSQAFYWSRLETGPAFSFLYRLTTGPVLCSHLPHLYHQQFFFQFQKNILLKGIATVTAI